MKKAMKNMLERLINWGSLTQEEEQQLHNILINENFSEENKDLIFELYDKNFGYGVEGDNYYD